MAAVSAAAVPAAVAAATTAIRRRLAGFPRFTQWLLCREATMVKALLAGAHATHPARQNAIRPQNNQQSVTESPRRATQGAD
jgi:hypothetical protein